MLDRAQLISWLREEIAGALGPLISGTGSVALLDFPNHTNVGDSAIWLGQLRALSALGSGRVVYSCDVRTYDRDMLARRIGDGAILISGGGSTGDVWERHQRFHEDIVAAFPHNRIILLPQSIHFGRADSLARARGVFSRHSDLTLMARDRTSFEIAERQLACHAVLCPDMAFALGRLRRSAGRTLPVVWLARQDKEALVTSTPPVTAGVHQSDWLDEPPTRLTHLSRRLGDRLARRGAMAPLLRSVTSLLYPALARRRLARGCRLLSEGRAVVTDRLHGHILCLLLGIPHILLDNSYGKVSAFYRTWTHHSELVRWCDSADEALEMLRSTPCS
ncbi:MAG TPA: polysaccharide pyruvyl transferase family protein [Gemmatimonadaceae bacterium]|nr:polysaccharide pyruvyl transferase family protein [Gemmatimonadaceae bacterium]